MAVILSMPGEGADTHPPRVTQGGGRSG